MIIDDELKKYASPRQIQIIDAVNEHGSLAAASRALGINDSNVSRALSLVRMNAATRGYDPRGMRSADLPAPFMMKGFSRLRNLQTGEDILQWDKAKVDDQLRAKAILDAFENAAASVPRLPLIKKPKHTLANLLNLYTFTDYHLGMRAWGPESGQDWDLEKGERILVEAFHHMVASAPPARVGFINQLGDFLHSDGLLPITPTSHHVLDQGATYAQMVEAAIRVLRRLVDFALQKHEKVVILMAEGNHDLASSVWLRALFKALYEKEPRVEVIDEASPYYVYEFGVNMLCFHHGHKIKNEALPALFASRFRDIWGRCRKVFIHTGHRHHTDEKDVTGARIIQHPTLAAADSHSARAGYDTMQEASVITYHDRVGQAARNFVNPEMLEAA